MLETTEQYNYTRTYIMNYIVDLINKKGIRRKDVLKDILLIFRPFNNCYSLMIPVIFVWLINQG